MLARGVHTLLLGQGRAAGLVGARALSSTAAPGVAAGGGSGGEEEAQQGERPRNRTAALNSLTEPGYLHNSYSHVEYQPRRRIILNSMSDPLPGWLNSSMSDAHYDLPGHVRVAPNVRPRQGFSSARSSAGTNMQRIVVVSRASITDPEPLHDSYAHGEYVSRPRKK